MSPRALSRAPTKLSNGHTPLIIGWSRLTDGARRVQQRRSLMATTARDDDREESVLELEEVAHQE